MDVARQHLHDVWGYEDFRGVQEKVIERLLEGKNALCLMPTGGGKSLCFQVPALCLDGLTLVVSPLIALMKDQVDALRKRGVAAASMDSSLSTEEAAAVRADLRNGRLKILYVAPERLNNELFISMVSAQKIALLAVDESHCVSEWGPSFRAEYLKVSRFAKEVNAERVLCLTATATPSVVVDICNPDNGFDIDLEEGVFSTGAYRPNLTLSIKPCLNQKAKLAVLVPFLQSRGDGASIVYVTIQKQADELAAELVAKDVDARAYHAGMAADKRKEVQDWFIAGNGVVVATIAFGMGIDKANIRQIVHYMLPKTLENYSQEIGRAGRDGLPSTCMMLPSASDYPILESFARANTPSEPSVSTWLKSVFASTVEADGTISFNHFADSNEFDIGRNTLSLLFAILELQFGLLRATTPFYSTYQFKPHPSNPNGFTDVLKGNPQDAAAAAIRSVWKKGNIWITVDAVEAAERSGVPRVDIVRRISRWEMDGACEVKVTGVRNRYIVLQDLPQSDEEIAALAKEMYRQLHEREEADVTRLRSVAQFIRGGQCYAHELATYFGDKGSVPNGRCENCSYCKTGKPLSFEPKFDAPFSDKQIKFVLGVCGVRDDPRFLARLAFGVSSPRITTLGLSKHSIFGCCDTANFGSLLERFEAECAENGYKNKPVLAPPKPTAGKAGGESAAKKPAAGAGAKKPAAGGSAKTPSSAAGNKRVGGWGAKAAPAAKKAKK
ncbi:hypothetical protein JCM8097_003845 [Rhodosporidiobolus ruineniae]